MGQKRIIEERHIMKQSIERLLGERILVLDGAMGTMLQAYKFEEADYRGERFKDYPSPLKGNNLSLIHI